MRFLLIPMWYLSRSPITEYLSTSTRKLRMKWTNSRKLGSLKMPLVPHCASHQSWLHPRTHRRSEYPSTSVAQTQQWYRERHHSSTIVEIINYLNGVTLFHRLVESFQHIIQQILQGIPGVRNISDDIIVLGTDQHRPDHTLCAVLAGLKQKGLTLNYSKC